MPPTDIAIPHWTSIPNRLEYEVLGTFCPHHPDALLRTASAPVNFHFQRFEATNTRNDRWIDADAARASLGLCRAPVAPAEAFINDQCFVSHILPSKANQFADPQSGKNCGTNHRAVWLNNKFH